jgi:hypothetical protein
LRIRIDDPKPSLMIASEFGEAGVTGGRFGMIPPHDSGCPLLGRLCNVLRRHGLLPAPPRSQRSWREFVRHHAEQMLAVDFFPVETVWRQRLHVLFFLEIGSRCVQLAGCTASPTGGWVVSMGEHGGLPDLHSREEHSDSPAGNNSSLSIGITSGRPIYIGSTLDVRGATFAPLQPQDQAFGQALGPGRGWVGRSTSRFRWSGRVRRARAGSRPAAVRRPAFPGLNRAIGTARHVPAEPPRPAAAATCTS